MFYVDVVPDVVECWILRLVSDTTWPAGCAIQLIFGVADFVPSEDRIPVGARLSTPFPGRPWDPPSLLQNGCRDYVLGVKRPGGGVSHPHPSSAEVKERVELYLCSPSRLSWRTLPLQLLLQVSLDVLNSWRTIRTINLWHRSVISFITDVYL